MQQKQCLRGNRKGWEAEEENFVRHRELQDNEKWIS